ncbi:MAG: polysaccharide deacetylase family protein [Clostridia bacterium]|nr:polysaccharide deacetylase family protein [Clostridia bacterium]
MEKAVKNQNANAKNTGSGKSGGTSFRRLPLAFLSAAALIILAMFVFSGCNGVEYGIPAYDTRIPVMTPEVTGTYEPVPTVSETEPVTPSETPSEEITESPTPENETPSFRTPDGGSTPDMSESPAASGSPEFAGTPSPEVSETPETPDVTPTETPAPTPTPTHVYFEGERYARTEAPDAIDYSFLENTEAGVFPDVNQTTGQWHSGQWKFDSNGNLVCVYDKTKATLKFLKEHHAFDRLPTTEKKLMLSIAVGYYNKYFPMFVDLLKEKNVQAVFFLTGSTVKSSSGPLLRTIIGNGNIIGSHSYAHNQLPTLEYSEIVRDANLFYDTLAGKIGFRYLLRYYMPPAGASTRRDIALLEYLGYTVSFWTFTYRDYDKQPIYSNEEAFERLKHSVFPGCVVYIHGTSEMTYNVLGDYIDYARAQGYEFVLPNSYFE